MSISSKFQKRIKELVEEKDLKKTDLCAEIGIDYAIFSKAINYGIIPRIKILMRIADYFDISVEYLVGNTDMDYFVKSQNSKLIQERLTELKDEKETTFYEMSKKLPFDRSYFTAWTKATFKPTLENLEILAEFFDVSIDYILGRTDDRKF